MPDRPAKRKPRSSPAATAGEQVRIRVWIDRAGAPALTEAGADLLEQIAIAGSLSEAARRLHFSYRRAWMLIDAINAAWTDPLVVSATGGKGGGGANLTPHGQQVLAAFRQLQLTLEHAAGEAAEAFSTQIRHP